MISEISSHGWKRNLLLRNAGVELLITLDVGPRILRFAFEGGANVFKEFPAHLGRSGETAWRARGGHRFWTAPEDLVSYALDNEPLDYGVISDQEVEVFQPKNEPYGFQKSIRVELDEKGVATVRHTLKNISNKPLTLIPWALSVMETGGTAIIPRAPLGRHPAELLPPDTLAADTRSYLPTDQITLWNYTNLSDPRFTFGPDFWFIQQDPTARAATKFGLYLTTGWVGYQVNGTVFIKSVPLEPGATYPDRNSNFELYTDSGILELETLAPIASIEPENEVYHTEVWRLLSESRSIRDLDVARKVASKV